MSTYEQKTIISLILGYKWKNDHMLTKSQKAFL